MGLTVAQIAAIISAEVIGDGQLTICGAEPLRDAMNGHLTLLDHPKNLGKLQRSPATAVVVLSTIEGLSIPQLVVTNAHQAFSKAVALFRPQSQIATAGIHRGASVDPTAKVGAGAWIAEGASVGRHCVIGDRVRIHRSVHIMDHSIIGDDCELFPGVVIYENTTIGQRVLIHASSVIGAYGFGYRQVDGRHVRTSQLGYVRIEDDVEIGAGSTIDRGTYGATSIGQGTKIDNQVMIGHNCAIGKHNLICAQVGIAGSTTTGDYVVLAGQVGIRDHVALADRVTVGAQSGVAGDLAADQVYIGSPAMPQKQYMQQYMVLSRLPQLREQLQQLAKSVAALESQAAHGPETAPNADSQRRVA